MAAFATSAPTARHASSAASTSSSGGALSASASASSATRCVSAPSRSTAQPESQKAPRSTALRAENSHLRAATLLRDATRRRVVRAGDRDVVALLARDDARLRRDVAREVAVPVEVVGRDVQDHRGARPERVDGLELEGRDLEHRDVERASRPARARDDRCCRPLRRAAPRRPACAHSSSVVVVLPLVPVIATTGTRERAEARARRRRARAAPTRSARPARPGSAPPGRTRRDPGTASPRRSSTLAAQRVESVDRLGARARRPRPRCAPRAARNRAALRPERPRPSTSTRCPVTSRISAASARRGRRAPRIAEMIQKRITIVCSCQPSFSKWWWIGAIRKTRLPVSWNQLTWIITESASITKMPPTTPSRISCRISTAIVPSAPPSASEPTSPMNSVRRVRVEPEEAEPAADHRAAEDRRAGRLPGDELDARGSRRCSRGPRRRRAAGRCRRRSSPARSRDRRARRSGSRRCSRPRSRSRRAGCRARRGCGVKSLKNGTDSSVVEARVGVDRDRHQRARSTICPSSFARAERPASFRLRVTFW